MAEAFARHLGAGVLQATSAGVFPAPVIQPETYQVMQEHGVAVEQRAPRSVHAVDGASVDLIVNMAPMPVKSLLQGFRGREVPWPVRDPIGQAIEVYRAVRDQIERRVEELVEEARR